LGHPGGHLFAPLGLALRENGLALSESNLAVGVRRGIGGAGFRVILALVFGLCALVFAHGALDLALGGLHLALGLLNGAFRILIAFDRGNRVLGLGGCGGDYDQTAAKEKKYLFHGNSFSYESIRIRIYDPFRNENKKFHQILRAAALGGQNIRLLPSLYELLYEA
jgi:hypothetical protein